MILAALGLVLSGIFVASALPFVVLLFGIALLLSSLGQGFSVSQGITLAVFVLAGPLCIYLTAWFLQISTGVRSIAFASTLLSLNILLTGGFDLTVKAAATGLRLKSLSDTLLICMSVINTGVVSIVVVVCSILLSALAFEVPFNWLGRAARVHHALPMDALRSLIVLLIAFLSAGLIADLFEVGFSSDAFFGR